MKSRSCKIEDFHSGASHCEIDHGKIKAAILVKHGITLGTDLIDDPTGASHTGKYHVIKTFCEYAKNGGEPQFSSVGYGPEKMTGYSSMQDQFTLEEYSESLVANIVAVGNSKYDVFYVSEDGIIYGCGFEKGSAKMCGFPLSSVSVTPTPYSSSGSQATAVVNFSHADAKKSLMYTSYIKTDVDCDELVALTPVDVVKTGTGSNSYKILESVGGYDVTALFAVSTRLTEIFPGATAVTYENEELNIVGEFKLADSNVLFSRGISGFVWSGKIDRSEA